MTNAVYTYQLELETLTPVHVGSGKKYTLHFDYEMINNTVHVFHHRNFNKYLEKKNLSIEYLEYLRKNIGYKGLKNNYWEEAYTTAENRNEFVMQSIKMYTHERAISGDIAAHWHTLGSPSIPGSSIKGAIRGILEMMLFRNQPQSKLDELKAIFKDALIPDRRNPKRIISEKLENQGTGYFKRQLTEKTSEFIFRHLFCDDAELTASQSKETEIHLFDRINLISEKSTNQLTECLPAGRQLQASVKMDGRFLLNISQSILSGASLQKELPVLINQFNQQLLNYELLELKKALNHARGEHQTRLKGFINVINELNRHLNNCEGTPSFLLRIGGGKMHFHQGLGWHFLNSFPVEFARFREKYLDGKTAGKAYFPVTRIATSHQPPGWLKVTIHTSGIKQPIKKHNP